MHAPDPTDTVSAVHRLKQEIDRLTQEHAKALKDAVYIGMTQEQAQVYDQRRKKITELIQKLSLLESQ